MNILIADDDSVSRRLLEASLSTWGYSVITTADGRAAWEVLRGNRPPQLAVLDWMMPGLDGTQICREVRANRATEPIYLILLSSRDSKDSIIEGLEAGADDYLAKPFDRDELHARIRVGVRTVELRQKLAEEIRQHEEALSEIKVLHGILPICCYCKDVRNDQNYWQQVESYISAHSEAKFSHSICPACYERFVEPELVSLQAPVRR